MEKIKNSLEMNIEQLISAKNMVHDSAQFKLGIEFAITLLNSSKSLYESEIELARIQGRIEILNQTFKQQEK